MIKWNITSVPSEKIITDSQLCLYSWDYDSTVNDITYDTDEELWSLDVTIGDLPADLKTLIHRYLVHFRGLLIEGPLLITNHNYNAISETVTVYFDSPAVAELSVADSASVLCIFDEPKQRKVFKFIELLKKLIPHWVQVKIS